MTSFRILPIIAAAVGLSGCAISSGFSGPGFDPARGVAGDGTVILALTKGSVEGGYFQRAQFRTDVRAVVASLSDRPGLIGHAVRRELFGPEVWTMSVWRDEASLDAFVASKTHQRAIEQSFPSFERAKFARTAIPASDVPVSWEKAEEILAAQGRRYD